MIPELNPNRKSSLYCVKVQKQYYESKKINENNWTFNFKVKLQNELMKTFLYLW